MKYVLMVVMSFVATGCGQISKRTSPLYQRQFYVETVAVSPLGVEADYLTDFASFRVEVGTVDAEHEDFAHTCRGDTLLVVKLVHGAKNRHWVTLPGGQQSLHCDTDTVKRKTYNVQALRRNEAVE